MLLYKNERQQYEAAISDDVTPSSIYGAEHLLRLFGIVVYLHISRVHTAYDYFSTTINIFVFAVKLPKILYYANIEEATLSELQQNLVDFLK